MPSEDPTDLAAAVERLRTLIPVRDRLDLDQQAGGGIASPYVSGDYLYCDDLCALLDAFDTVLAALPQWKPIETAPRDGTQIMLASINADHSCASSGYWTNHNGGGWVRRIPWEPNYWMELPQPPQHQQKASEP